jgi:hypothetical protein
MSNQCNISSHAGFSGFRFSSTADSRDNDARETTEAMLRTCARRVASRVTVRSRRDERTRRANATSERDERRGLDWNRLERVRTANLLSFVRRRVRERGGRETERKRVDDDALIS